MEEIYERSSVTTFRLFYLGLTSFRAVVLASRGLITYQPGSSWDGMMSSSDKSTLMNIWSHRR